MSVRVRLPVLPCAKPVHQQTPAEALANLRHMENSALERIRLLENLPNNRPARLEQELAQQRYVLALARRVIAGIEEIQGGRVLH